MEGLPVLAGVPTLMEICLRKVADCPLEIGENNLKGKHYLRRSAIYISDTILMKPPFC